MSHHPPRKEHLILHTMRQLAEELSLEDVESLAEELIEELPTSCQEIEDAVLRANSETSNRLAHSLKGTANIFGLQELIDVCQIIEDASREGQMETAQEQLVLLKESGHHSMKAVVAALVQLRSIDQSKE